MASIKVPDDTSKKLKKIQAALTYKYSETLTQLKILFHINESDFENEDCDKLADKIHLNLTKGKSDKSANIETTLLEDSDKKITIKNERLKNLISENQAGQQI